MSCDCSRNESLLTGKKDTIKEEIKSLEKKLEMMAYLRRTSASQILALEYSWEMDCINRRLELLYYSLKKYNKGGGGNL